MLHSHNRFSTNVFAFFGIGVMIFIIGVFAFMLGTSYSIWEKEKQALAYVNANHNPIVNDIAIASDHSLYALLDRDGQMMTARIECREGSCALVQWLPGDMAYQQAVQQELFMRHGNY